MNERIKELAEQASHQSPDGYPVTIPYSNDFVKKFAELLIQECATLKLDPMQIDEAQYYHGWLDYRDKIWKHFGEKA